MSINTVSTQHKRTTQPKLQYRQSAGTTGCAADATVTANTPVSTPPPSSSQRQDSPH